MEDYAIDTSTPKKQEPLETLVCEHCSHSNVISSKPLKRRPKVLKTISVETATYNKLKSYCIQYGSINNGINMMLWEIEKMRMQDLYKLQESEINTAEP